MPSPKGNSTKMKGSWYEVFHKHERLWNSSGPSVSRKLISKRIPGLLTDRMQTKGVLIIADYVVHMTAEERIKFFNLLSRTFSLSFFICKLVTLLWI